MKKLLLFTSACTLLFITVAFTPESARFARPSLEDIAEDWKLSQLTINGEPYAGNTSNFRLVLSGNYTYKRISLEGFEDKGSWRWDRLQNQIILNKNTEYEEVYQVQYSDANSTMTFTEKTFEKNNSYHTEYILWK
ncbi:hypothetical protein AAG747_24865 [Rapidithrix thailandica]|uniref:Uncharacterized protein n=1 Tax=Rapidithrix thailandica TaxID=413964 RepID=A0AAW9SF88_9BACT